MIVSMTGFGYGEVESNGTIITAELRSVNGRFIDVSVKLPRSYAEHEVELSRKISSKLRRGRISLTVSIKKSQETGNVLSINEEVVENFITQFRVIKDKFGLTGELEPSVLLQFPDIVNWESRTGEDEGDNKLIEQAVDEALKKHIQMRHKEGRAIEKDVVGRARKLLTVIERIEKKTPESAESLRKRLNKRIRELGLNPSIDKQRIALEVTLFAERTDITEECVRFKSHLSQFQEEIKKKSTSGRKLMFIIQELLRESNTIASKCQNARIINNVLIIKDELEKIREQIENVE